jgi:hypothetical protein
MSHTELYFVLGQSLKIIIQLGREFGDWLEAADVCFGRLNYRNGLG